MVRVGVLQIEIGEIKDAFPQLKEELKREFDVKLRNAELYSRTAAETRRDFKVFVEDSTRINDIYVERGWYEDQWIDFAWWRPYGSYSSQVHVVVPDSLIQVVYKDRQKGFPFGRDSSK